MKILYVVSGLSHPGGIENFCKMIIENIDLKLFQIDFFVNDNQIGSFGEYFQSFDCKIFHLSKNASRKVRVKERERFFMEHKNEYDIVHIHTVLTTAYQTAKVAKKYGAKKVIVHSHTAGNYEGAALKNNLFRPLLNKYTDIRVGCSQQALKFLFGHKSSIHSFVVFNPIDLSKFAFDLQTRNTIREQLNINDSFVVGHVGRFTQAKNHSFLCKVFCKLLESKPNSILLLLGDGALKPDILTRIQNLNMKEHVLVLGNKDNVFDYVNAMDVFAFPSKYEGFPTVLIEAQTNGLPIIASDHIGKDVNKYIDSKVIPIKNNRILDWVKAIGNSKRMDSKVSLNEFDGKNVAKYLETIYQNAIERGKMLQ